jgi:hypothetical protein
MTFYALQKLRASQLNAMLSKTVRKLVDESVTNAGTGTTLQDDDELFVSVDANTSYIIGVTVFGTEAAGTGIDLKVAWTMPSGCSLYLGGAAPHNAWVAGAGAALEAEWAGWITSSSPTSSITFGTTNVAIFTYHWSGTLVVGSTSGTFRMQWAQGNSSASALTVKAGSNISLTPILG